ncbi:DUF6029 family protein [uncultured Alistipes sp.]|jgi:hypothetical protein|uniref:DUF6029 family protein n=1 Tax=Alistipes TaxID=239759 RepID=UPI00266DCD32|nr:DUF6029 family protein [uncultured Alistipes sp.]
MKKITLLLLGATCALSAGAQIRLGDGQLSGSFETNSIYYVADTKMMDVASYAVPGDRFGSNNYLKLDYNYGRFSAGIQMEAYMPMLQGFNNIPDAFHGFKLASKYVQWQDENFAILVGDIYDQFGNGLIFRSYEDRALGFNNSLEGVRGIYNFGNYVQFKGLYGRPRLYMDYEDSWIRGADLSVSLADIFGLREAMFTLEGSYVNRYQKIDEDKSAEQVISDQVRPNLNMYSGRLNLDWKGITARFEYVTKGEKDLYSVGAKGNAAKGNVYLAELGYSHKGFSVLGSFRRLEHMGTLLSIYGEGTGNLLNYIPALTRQYTYLLTNLNPYQGTPEGEIGGQVDVYYSLRNKSARYKYWNLHANFSTYYTLKKQTGNKTNLLWRDINVDVERQWNRSLKTSLLLSRQEWSPDHGTSGKTLASNIVVGDVTYKFNPRYSLRAELQYLYSDHVKPNDRELADEAGTDWLAFLLEFNIAPKWSFFFSDMMNFDRVYPENGVNVTSTIHYPSGGFSFTKSRTRIQLSFGRNRQGFVCSGGVCREQPAFTGVSLLLTSSF